MRYVSTKGISSPVSFRDAVLQGLPADNGLFMPQKIEPLPSLFWNKFQDMSIVDACLEVVTQFIEDEIPESELRRIISETLNFDIPLVQLDDHIYTLELFHGPTMAFKDIGARFMARCLGYFSRNNSGETVVLVATSGDTGSAVAHGFFKVEGVKVVILYPSKKVSRFQELQMTSLGNNITCLEVDGNFDDCQRLVKSAFLDPELNDRLQLTSANSINIARLLPQIFYYFSCFKQNELTDMAISVPSGNYGNITAGLIAKKLGLPIKKFIASSNVNDIVPNYLHSGEFSPRPSTPTISNAMDVGNPSNFSRMSFLYEGSLEKMKVDIEGLSFTDSETRKAIIECYDKYNYIMDPHGAVGYLGLKEYLRKNDSTTGIFLETAHPVKFKEVVEPIIHQNLEYPAQGLDVMNKTKLTMELSSEFTDFKKYLLNLN